MAEITKPLMRYHGAKFRLAPWIMSFFPEHYTYVEPFGGAAGVLLQKPRSMSEVYNDLDSDITNVFCVLRDKSLSLELEQSLRLTPYSRNEFNLSYEPTDCPVESARRTIIRAHMGFGSAGATKGVTGFRIDSAREYGTTAHLWAKYPDEVARFVDRLQSVVIENKDAIEVINNHDRDNTLFFVDPPYVHSTRKMKHDKCYRHEMTDDQHIKLLRRLNEVKGFVVLSGYESDFYKEHLVEWEMHTKKARISAGRGTGTRMECVWLNPACAESQNQKRLFA